MKFLPPLIGLLTVVCAVGFIFIFFQQQKQKADLKTEQVKLQQQQTALQTAQSELEKERLQMAVAEKREAIQKAAADEIEQVYLKRLVVLTNAYHPSTLLPYERDQFTFKFSSRKYLDALAKVDTSKCPNDFRVVFAAYIETWRKKSEYSPVRAISDTATIFGAFVRPVLAAGLSDVAKRRDEMDAPAAWAEVEKVGLNYGASPPAKLRVDFDALSIKDLNLEYTFSVPQPKAQALR